MASNSQQQRTIPIDAAMRARFDHCAPDALKRRTPARLRGHMFSMLQWLVIGSIGLLGIYVWHWPPIALLIVWLAGMAAGIVGDLLLWIFVRRRIVRQFREFTDDQFVWYMVTALQRKQDHVLDSAMQVYKPGFNLSLDVAFGAVATGVFAVWFQAKGIDVSALIGADPALQKALLAVAATPLITLLSSIVTLTSNKDAEVDFHAGGRGFGLLGVIIAFIAFSEAEDGIGSLIVFINGATVFVGLLAAFGVWVMGQERVWLEKHLASK